MPHFAQDLRSTICRELEGTELVDDEISGPPFTRSNVLSR